MALLERSSESGGLIQAMVDNAGLRSVGTPEDIAAATAFLLGPAAAFITGTDLLVDGGAIAAIQTGTIDLAKALADRLRRPWRRPDVLCHGGREPLLFWAFAASFRSVSQPTRRWPLCSRRGNRKPLLV